MKKMMKKLIAMAAALVMIVTLLPAVGVKAETTITADEATLTIDKHDSVGNSLAGATFEIYKVATLDTTKTTQISYNVTEQFKSKISNEDIQGLGELSANELETKAVELAGGLTGGQSYTSSNPATPITIEKKDFGLYLIVEKTAPEGYAIGAPFFVDVPRTVTKTEGEITTSEWNYNVVVTPKNGSTQLTKKIVVNENEKVDADSVKNGDTITYNVSGYLPYLTQQELAASTIKIEITDTLSGGLIFEDATMNMSLKINEVDVTNKYSAVIGQDNTSFTITITDKEFIKANNGKAIELQYTAKVNNASYLKPAANQASIEVNDRPESDSTIPKVYTYAIKVVKKLGDDLAKENQVEFGLYSDADCKKQVGTAKWTNASGEIVFDGLVAENNGTTYYLKELTTVNGYTLLANPVAITLTPEVIEGEPTGNMTYSIDGTTYDQTKTIRLATANITNNKGFSLPETGGMGTYLFTIGGIVIMAGAAFALIAMKKRA